MTDVVCGFGVRVDDYIVIVVDTGEETTVKARRLYSGLPESLKQYLDGSK